MKLLHSAFKPTRLNILSGVLVCLCAWLSFPATAQEVATIHFQPNSNELPFADIFGKIVEDEQGYMWFGTEKGLFYYDGYQFRTIKLPKQIKRKTLLGLQQADNGTLVVSNLAGEILFKPPGADSLHILVPCDSFPDNFLSFIDLDGNNLLLVARSVKDPSKISIFIHDLETGNCKDRCVLPTNRSIFRNPEALLINDKVYYMRLDKTIKGKTIEMADSLKDIHPDIQWVGAHALYKSGKSTLINHKVSRRENQERDEWFYKVDLQNLSKHYLHGPIDDFDLVNYIDIDHQKNFWLLSESGAIVLDSVGRDVYLLPNRNRILEDRYLHNMINSKDNSYWFGSLGTGLFHIPNISTLHFKAENSGLQSNKIKLLKKVGAQLLVFTNDGHIYDWKNGQLKPLFWQKDCKEIYAVHETPSDLVLLYLDLSNIKSIQHIQYLPKTALLEGKLLNRMEPAPLILASGGYKSSCVDPWNLNDIHFGSAGGLCIFNKSLTENVTNRMESWRDVRNKQLFTDRFVPKIWIGKPNQLHYLEQPQDSSIAIQYRGKPLEIQVESIHQTIDSTIWVGTAANGVVGIRGDSIYTRLTVEDGLGNNACRYLHAGDEPYLWIVHSEGINRYDIRTGSMRHVNASDGMLSKNIYSVHQSGEQLLVGTEDGLFQLEVDDIEKLIPPTALHINQLKIWAADYPLQGDELSLPYNQNNLEIGFRGISIKSFQKIDYRYRMLGIDSTWTDIPKGVQFVHFPQLSYGDYQFELEALNADGVRSTQAATLNINISPPYWRTWWFSCLVIGGIALLTALIVNFIFRYRYRQQQKEQELLQQIQQLRADALRAQMNPHFIFNALNAILLFLARNDEKSAILFLSKFSRLIRYIFEYSHKDEIPIAEEIQLIEIYLNLEALRFKDKVDIQMKVSDSLRDAGESIPPLLIQPIIENSFKHGLFHKKERGVLKLHFKDLEDSIKVVIEDNGIGRKKAAELIRKKKIKRSISSQQVISDRIAVINQKADDPEKVVLKSEDLFDEVGNAAGLRTTFTFKVN